MNQHETSSMGVGVEGIAVSKRTNALIAISNAFGRSNAFRKALYVRMHDTPSFGSAIANISTNDWRNVEQLHLPKTDVANAIRSMTNGKMFDLIVAAFELHHVTAIETEDVCHAIGEALTPEGTFIMTDYALPTVDPSLYEPYIVGDTERRNVERYGGMNAWFQAHSGWNRERMMRMSFATDKPHVMSESLPGHSAMAIATGDQRILTATKAALNPYIDLK